MRGLRHLWRLDRLRGTIEQMGCADGRGEPDGTAIAQQTIYGPGLVGFTHPTACWFRNALTDMGIQPCIPSRKNRKVPIEHDVDLYKKRHKIENTFARIKDWRRIATRYDRCADLFLSACALAAVVMFWL